MADYARSLLSSTVYANALFVGSWCVVATLWTLGSALRERKVAAFHPRRLLIYLMPLIAPLTIAFAWIQRLLIAAFALLFFAEPWSLERATVWPEPGSPEIWWGTRIFGLFFLLYLGFVLRAAGIPPRVADDKRTRLIMVLLFMSFTFGLVLMFIPIGFWFGLPALALVYLACAVFITKRIGMAAHRAALVARCDPTNLPSAKGKGTPVSFVFLTDLHLTAKGRPRVEVRPPGNQRLAAIDEELGGVEARWIFLGGDVVDHGRDDEWEEAKAMLAKYTKQHSKTRVVVAPGNHDLGTAYRMGDAFMAHFAAQQARRAIPPANGASLKLYLKYAAALEKRLMTADGTCVAAVIRKDEAVEKDLKRRWEQLPTSSPKRAASLAKLAKDANKGFPEFSIATWERLLAKRTVKLFEDTIMPALWSLRWFDSFPLYVRDDQTKEAVVVLNSVAPDPTLFGSAWGAIGQVQLERLRSIAAKVAGYRLYILCHHPPVCWCPPGTDRNRTKLTFGEAIDWATHAVLSEDIEILKDILARVVATSSRETVFMCGHRHGGKTGETFIGELSAKRSNHHETPLGLIIEGASFAEAETRIAIGWEDDPGSLKLSFWQP